jgi:hypothetical protein
VGGDVSNSFGPFQILYATAIYYGYPKNVDPRGLESAETSGHYVVKLLNEKIGKGAKTADKLADAYNSGTHLDFRGPNVQRYVQKFLKIYNQTKEKEDAKIVRT